MIDNGISPFYKVIKEVLSQMDQESSEYFLEVFDQKMKELKEIKEINEQTNLQKNPGASR